MYLYHYLSISLDTISSAILIEDMDLCSGQDPESELIDTGLAVVRGFTRAVKLVIVDIEVQEYLSTQKLVYTDCSSQSTLSG